MQIVEKSYTDRGMKAPQIRTFDNYRELLARKDIDAVVISTPDHWHAEVALAAVEAGKDVYLQKPFTMTHAEGVILRDAVKRTGRILQVGSQQRSWEQFRRAPSSSAPAASAMCSAWRSVCRPIPPRPMRRRRRSGRTSTSASG